MTRSPCRYWIDGQCWHPKCAYGLVDTCVRDADPRVFGCKLLKNAVVMGRDYPPQRPVPPHEKPLPQPIKPPQPRAAIAMATWDPARPDLAVPVLLPPKAKRPLLGQSDRTRLLKPAKPAPEPAPGPEPAPKSSPFDALLKGSKPK